MSFSCPATAAPLTAEGAPDAIVVTGFARAGRARHDGRIRDDLRCETLDALGLPLASDTLRLAPGRLGRDDAARVAPRPRSASAAPRPITAWCSSTASASTIPQPATRPRFELLGTDALSRIELVRGPQSALWGSEALGGVVAVETADPLADSGLSALAEYGSEDSRRASAQFATRTGAIGLSGSAGWIESDGIDSFGAGGERDGFENRSASLKAVYAPSPAGEIGVVGHLDRGNKRVRRLRPRHVPARRHARCHEEPRRSAVRGWARTSLDGWALQVDGSYLDSANRNRLADDPLNSTFGERFTLGGQLSKIARAPSLHRRRRA